ncbi:hypothetical protein V8E55_007816 [Tylopilus felleus]
MAPLIRDGVYIIRNGEFNTFAVDHLYVSRYGPVVAYTEGPQNRYNKWTITNVGAGGNEVIIENKVLRPGCASCYVFADQFEIVLVHHTGKRNTKWTFDEVRG